jgi:serine kinase of HPr protein (carbohydrate metabolism regulator)
MSEIVHGTALLAGAQGVLIRGPSGAGKSALAYHLIRRGARLVADDRVFLSACHGRLVAAAVSPIAGLIELRGRGIVAVPHERSAVVRLIVDFVTPEALERMPDSSQLTAAILGIELARQPVPPATEPAAALLEAALASLSGTLDSALRSARV